MSSVIGKMVKLVVLGAPGAGKGTQAKILSERLCIPHISTGDMLRENMRDKTELGLRIAKTMDAGGLVSDEIVIDLVETRLAQEDCHNGYILDGFPRTLHQAEILERDADLTKTVAVEVPDQVIVDRVAERLVCPKCAAMYNLASVPPHAPGICDVCGAQLTRRPDDEPETVANRLTVYHRQAAPILDYYQKKGLLLRVDGTKDMSVVTAEIMQGLGL